MFLPKARGWRVGITQELVEIYVVASTFSLKPQEIKFIRNVYAKMFFQGLHQGRMKIP